jgi:hypothetical protein
VISENKEPVNSRRCARRRLGAKTINPGIQAAGFNSIIVELIGPKIGQMHTVIIIIGVVSIIRHYLTIAACYRLKVRRVCSIIHS